MEKQVEQLGSILQDIPGQACPFCGGNTYQLVPRSTGRLNDSFSFGCCRRCSHPRSFDAEFKRVLKVGAKPTRIWAMVLSTTETIVRPFHHLQAYVNHNRTTRKSLQMLALSGAVRPGHVELRYPTSLLAVEGVPDSFHDTPAPPIERPGLLTQFFESMRQLIMDLRSLRPYIDRGLSSFRVELESRLRSLSVFPSTTALVVTDGKDYAAMYDGVSHGIVESSMGSNDTLKRSVSGKVQGQVQRILEEEGSTIPDGIRLELRDEAVLIAAPAGSQNNYEKPDHSTVMGGAVTVLRPRVWNFAERFKSKVLLLFTRPTREIGRSLPEPYLQGLATGDFDVALRNLLGEGAPLSEHSLQRLKVEFQQEYDAWMKRDLSDLSLAYWWAAGVYVKAGIEDHKSALLTIVGALTTGEKIVLSCESGKPESKDSWLKLLRNLKHRGLRFPRLTVADGRLGIWAASGEIHPSGEGQGCWRHKIRNVLNALPKNRQPEASELLKAMSCAKTRTECEHRRDEFVRTYGRREKKAVDRLLRDWERMVKFYEFPQQHWRQIRTTDIVVSPFALARIRTNATLRYKRIEGAQPIIWKMLQVAEQSWPKLDAPGLLPVAASCPTFTSGLITPPAEAKHAVNHRSERPAA